VSDDALNEFCDWLESVPAHTIACPADCPLCLAADKLKTLQAKVDELTGEVNGLKHNAAVISDSLEIAIEFCEASAALKQERSDD
jgi:hypothetical protein